MERDKGTPQYQYPEYPPPNGRRMSMKLTGHGYHSTSAKHRDLKLSTGRNLCFKTSPGPGSSDSDPCCMLRSVYSREHSTERIQMTVLGGIYTTTDQLFRSNAALLTSGPSVLAGWAAPHARRRRTARQLATWRKDDVTTSRCWPRTRTRLSIGG